MAPASIALLTFAVLIGMSLRANRAFSAQARLPMQWSLSGSVNWTAPRLLALAFTPALGAIILAAMTVMSISMTPRPGQEGLEVPVMMVMALGLVAVHALHLWLIHRTLKTDGS